MQPIRNLKIPRSNLWHPSRPVWFQKNDDSKPQKKWHCHSCDSEYTKPELVPERRGLFTHAARCPACKTKMGKDEETGQSTQEYIGDDLN
jgi:uncharacterized paraquat-inducible protein A